MTKKVAKALKPGVHGSTFGGNPLAMTIGNAVLDQIFKKGFLKNVEKSSKYFRAELNKIKEDYPTIIKEIRGIGLWYAFDVTPVNYFILGGLSSGTSYVLNMIFGDEGIKHEHKYMDTQVDASTSKKLL